MTCSQRETTRQRLSSLSGADFRPRPVRLSGFPGNAVLERVDAESRADRIGDGVTACSDCVNCEDALDELVEGGNCPPVPSGLTSHLQLYGHQRALCRYHTGKIPRG